MDLSAYEEVVGIDKEEWRALVHSLRKLPPNFAAGNIPWLEYTTLAEPRPTRDTFKKLCDHISAGSQKGVAQVNPQDHNSKANSSSWQWQMMRPDAQRPSPVRTRPFRGCFWSFKRPHCPTVATVAVAVAMAVTALVEMATRGTPSTPASVGFTQTSSEFIRP